MGCSSSAPARAREGPSSAGSAQATPTPPPKAYNVAGAGIAQANGIYVLNGQYQGAPKWEKGAIWLLRYQMPSGRKFWYLADKNLLDRDDGDLYRVQADSPTPPHFGWKCAQDGIEPPPTLEALDGTSTPAPPPMAQPFIAPGVVVSPSMMSPNVPIVYGVPDGTGGAMEVVVYNTIEEAVPMGMPVEPSFPTVLAQPAPPQMIVAPPTASAPKASWAAADVTCIGDCLEVRDTHGLWAVARVAATLVVPPYGDLVLVHFEGWSNAWFMWLSPVFDADRIRPLSKSLPGLGSRGIHTKDTFLEKLNWCRSKLCAGASDWGVTGGKERTHPFKQQNKMRVTIREPHVWLAQQLQLQRVAADAPAEHWLTCHELANDAALCRAMCNAVLTPSRV